jgi:G3E family GTPase
VDQIEFANVVLLNKTDAVTKDVVDKVEGIVKTLNPYVTVHLHGFSPSSTLVCKTHG